MAKLTIERMGGLAGFGTPGSAVKSQGEIESGDLAGHDQKAVAALFDRKTAAVTRDESPVRDGFRYRISRAGGTKTDSVEVAEADVPAALIGCIKDELA